MKALPCIFNCSNDMALAANVRQYLPPKRVRQMENDLAMLARQWEGTRFAGPWGWSLAVKRRYERMGVPPGQLPSDRWLEEHRRLSSREYACGYIRQMLASIDDAMLLGSEMRFVGNKCDLHLSDDVTYIFKTPWSSSGRGVFVSPPGDRSMLGRMGDAFLVDRFYDNKVLDFAMEFFVEDGRAEFLGYSVFQASSNGTYGFNYVESQEELLRRIGVDRTLLQRLIDYHLIHLAETSYRGVVGIDMMKCATDCGYAIHPCVEMNFRMNMGVLALILHQRYGSHATVALTPERGSGFGARIIDGRLMIELVDSLPMERG